jgi:hypothetical protein
MIRPAVRRERSGAVTLEEYLDAQRFPLTTQKGLDPSNQLMLDAFKMDGMAEEREWRTDLGEHWHAVWAELEQKRPHHARLTREVAEAERAEGEGKKQ